MSLTHVYILNNCSVVGWFPSLQVERINRPQKKRTINHHPIQYSIQTINWLGTINDNYSSMSEITLMFGWLNGTTNLGCLRWKWVLTDSIQSHRSCTTESCALRIKTPKTMDILNIAIIWNKLLAVLFWFFHFISNN